jgi:quercetin dioxygenase-like cupin family protein
LEEKTMQVINHDSQPKEEWRPGVKTRLRIAELVGSRQLTIFDQWCDPGHGAPTHTHEVEEVLSVVEGEAEVWLDDERARLAAGQSVVIPASTRHGFSNIGRGTLVMQAVLAAPVFEAFYGGTREPSRRWRAV